MTIRIRECSGKQDFERKEEIGIRFREEEKERKEEKNTKREEEESVKNRGRLKEGGGYQSRRNPKRGNYWKATKRLPPKNERKTKEKRDKEYPAETHGENGKRLQEKLVCKVDVSVVFEVGQSM